MSYAKTVTEKTLAANRQNGRGQDSQGLIVATPEFAAIKDHSVRRQLFFPLNDY